MFYVSNSVLKDEFLAEDAVQTAFLKISQNISDIRILNDSETKAYVATIAKNMAINILNKKNNHLETSYDLLDNFNSDDTCDPEKMLFKKEDEEIFKAAFSEISEQYKDIMMFKYFYGYSNSHIAKLTNISNENVRVRLVRGKKQLSILLEREMKLRENSQTRTKLSKNVEKCNL